MLSIDFKPLTNCGRFVRSFTPKQQFHAGEKMNDELALYNKLADAISTLVEKAENQRQDDSKCEDMKLRMKTVEDEVIKLRLADAKRSGALLIVKLVSGFTVPAVVTALLKSFGAF